MPPKITPRGRGGPPSAGRGSAPAGAPSARPAVQRIISTAGTPQLGGPSLPAAHVVATGVKRPGFGSSGKPTSIITNHFELKFNTSMIYQYDVSFLPESKKYPKSFTREAFQMLRTENPELFGSCIYDGRKIMYTAGAKLPLTNDAQEFQVTMTNKKVYKVRITKTDQEINPEVLDRFLRGQQTHDTAVLVTINSFNVALNMAPKENPAVADGGRSFYMRNEFKDIGRGMELWRGFFQSARPGLGKMLVNVDISTALFYKAGPLMNLALEHLQKPLARTDALLERNVTPSERHTLSTFFKKLSVVTIHNKELGKTPRLIERVLPTSAESTTFKTKEGQTKTIANFFREAYGRPLRYPGMICVQVKTGAILPMEVCEVLSGQIRRTQLTPEITAEMVGFATRKPQDKLASLRNAPQFLGYSNNPYTTAFGMNVIPNFLNVNSRVLPPPTLLYGPESKPTPLQTRPGEGSWNMSGKKYFKPASFEGWVIAVFDHRFNNYNAIKDGLVAACTKAGIVGFSTPPIIKPGLNGQSPHKIHEQLVALGKQYMDERKSKQPPALFVVILPENATPIYNAVKHFGDIKMGVATQCLRGMKLRDPKATYWDNVALKVNCKLGGVNVVPEPRSSPFLGDPSNPTMILGADAVHPAIGTFGKPSYTCVVGSVDSQASRYTSTSAPQKSGQEIIEDMEGMVTQLLKDHIEFKTRMERKTPESAKPKRIVMFRDGVSEGQFSIVVDEEVPKIRSACRALGMNVKLTFIVVGKRHHVRFFPKEGGGDRSGNCLAGTVVDTEVVHPVEHDFYLQSHAGLLGTSRPAHYNILVDDNNMTADAAQQLAFAMTHIYQRSTRSVSIPAPTYYADTICARTATHYDPASPFFSDSGTETSGADPDKVWQQYKDQWKTVNPRTRTRMYWQ